MERRVRTVKGRVGARMEARNSASRESSSVVVFRLGSFGKVVLMGLCGSLTASIGVTVRLKFVYRCSHLIGGRCLAACLGSASASSAALLFDIT